LLAAPVEGVANFGKYGYGEEAVPYNAGMAFDAAGGAMTGGLGVGLAGGLADNAVGSAGGRLRAYHGTPEPGFDRLKQDSFFSPMPDIASEYAGRFMGGPGDTNAARVFPVDLDFKNPLTIDAAIQDANMIKTVKETIGQHNSRTPLESSARKAGYDGIIYESAGGRPPEYQAIRPGTVYSATTGDLLYANAPTGAAIPLAGEAQDDTDPALAQYLRLLGIPY